MNHPSEDILGQQSQSLQGKRIVLGITGSVAAVKSSEIARYLMRHGAKVYPVMTKAAQGIIHPDLMTWATGEKTITELTGAIEHVALAGNVPDPVDLILVAPATANTLSKIAHGIDDTPVTTFVTTALGQGIPLVVVPAMHESMFNHPILRENIKKLESFGIPVVTGPISEGKAKIASTEEIFQKVLEVLREDKPLKGKTFVITAGRTVEFIDTVRVITNNSTGKMGIALAKAAAALGAQVTLIYGKGTEPEPQGVRVIRVSTADEMYQAVEKAMEAAPDVFMGVAAVGDWKLREPFQEKVSTLRESLTLELIPTPKILDQVKRWSPKTFVVAFRAQTGLGLEELKNDAQSRLKKAQANLIAANWVDKPDQGFESETNALLVLDDQGFQTQIPLASKAEIAKKLLALIQERL